MERADSIYLLVPLLVAFAAVFLLHMRARAESRIREDSEGDND